MDPFTADDLILAYALLQAVVALLLVRFLDLYEREPFSIVAVMFLWGAIGAAIIASVGNEALQGQLPHDVEVVFGPAISAPVIEELAKGVALAIAFAGSYWAHRKFGVLEFSGVTDGIVYGAAVGIGFAFTEDLYYFFHEARLDGVSDALRVFVDRRDFFGPASLRHAIWTATLGAGIGLATVSRGWAGRIGWPLLGLALAMAMHAINNGLVPVLLSIKYGFTTAYQFLAIGVPVDLAERMQRSADSAQDVLRLLSWAYVALFIAAIALWLRHQRRVIAAELEEEVGRGLISEPERRLAGSYLARLGRQWRQLRAGDLDGARRTSALCRDLAELAFAKRRDLHHPGGDQREVDGCRRRVELLSRSGAGL